MWFDIAESLCQREFASALSLKTIKSIVKHFIVSVIYILDHKISSLIFFCTAFDIYSMSFFVSVLQMKHGLCPS